MTWAETHCYGCGKETTNLGYYNNPMNKIKPLEYKHRYCIECLDKDMVNFFILIGIGIFSFTIFIIKNGT